jgi:DNA-binding winged helix-turn-helix (wHTH) protein
MNGKTELFYEFAGFRLDVAKRILIRQGEPVALAPKVFDTLLFLVQNSGQILEKDVLMRSLWPDSFVEEGNLSQNIFVLRKVLGNARNGNNLIQTIPRRGYRFVATVKQIDASAPENGHLGSPQSSLVADYWNCHSPFRGLQVFEPEDAWLFFGRDSETGELLERLTHAPLLAVVGNSGSGKSSLIRAGLIPALRAGRFCSEDMAMKSWRIALFRPAGAPFDYLAEVLASQLAPELSLKKQAEFISNCRDKVPVDKDALRNAISALINATVSRDNTGQVHVLLVADQFEELFTLTSKRETRDRYIDALLAASRPGGSIAVHVVLALRADFYAQCLEHAELSLCLQANQYNVPRMSREQLRESMERRLQLAAAQAEPGLIDSLLEEVSAEPGNLALLEHALGQLWDKCGGYGCTLTNQAYAEIGRLRGALGRHADEVYASLRDDRLKSLAQKIFLELVHLGEDTGTGNSNDTRRRVSKTDLLSLGDTEEVEQLLARLASSRLISTGGSEQETFVEVSHEALIREWSTLREWIAQNREQLQLERRLGQAAQEWESLNRDPGALLQGARLAQGEEWLTRHEDAPAHLREYLLAGAAARSEAVRRGRLSQAREHAERTALDARLGWIFGAVAFIAVIIMDALWVAYHPEWAAGRHLRDQVLTSFKREPWEVVLWLAATPLQVAAYWVVIRRRFYRTWKALTWYLVFEIAESVVLIPVFLFRSPAYFFGYYVFGIAETIFRCLLVLEILIKVLNPFEALPGRRIAWFFFWAVQGISVVIAFSANQRAGDTWYSWISIVGTTILMANGGLLAIMLFQARELGIPWKSPVVEIALGLVLYSAVETVNRLLFYGYGNRALNPAASVAYLIMLMGWIWTMLYRDPYLTAPLSFAKKRPG